MSPENTKKLYDAFPRLYRGRVKSLEESSMAWGFMCGDGWFPLIWALSREIERVARREGRDPVSDDWPEAMQVKEKIGSLRFHLHPRTRSPRMRTLVEAARAASEDTCEECGKPGVTVQQGWPQSRCQEHANAAIHRTPGTDRR